MSDFSYLRSDSEVGKYVKHLKDSGIRSIAMDIEAEFNLHVYGERFCLLQLYDGQEQLVVDPFDVSRDALASLLENRDLLKITFDSASDRVLLAKTHSILLNSILDLKPAVELLEFPKQDLSSVMESALGLQSRGGKKRYQQYNWTRRPIDSGAIEYALQDVRHLFDLKDALLERLHAAGTMDLFILENLKRQDQPPETNRKPGILRSGRFKRLTSAQRAEFQRLFDIRDRYARELDLPPNTVVANNDLFALVVGELIPADIRGNRRVPGEALQAIRREMTTEAK